MITCPDCGGTGTFHSDCDGGSLTAECSACDGTGRLHMVTKGDHITASWMRTNLTSLAGVQMKLEGQQVSVSGIVRHVRGNDPIAPTSIRIYIDPDDPACELPRARPPRCTCPRPHVEVEPQHVTGR